MKGISNCLSARLFIGLNVCFTANQPFVMKSDMDSLKPGERRRLLVIKPPRERKLVSNKSLLHNEFSALNVQVFRILLPFPVSYIWEIELLFTVAVFKDKVQSSSKY